MQNSMNFLVRFVNEDTAPGGRSNWVYSEK